MLRKYMVLYAPDANAGEGSSASLDEKGQVSSPEQQAEQQATEESTEQSVESTEEESETATDTTQESGTAEQKTDETAQAEKAVLDKPEDEKLPFHKEPRFQELIKEKNTYKSELDALKPLAERTKVLDAYVTQHQIQPQQIQAALEYCRLLNSDPAKAYEMLRPAYEKLAGFVGDRLPVDLQERVAAGTLEPELAKELARGRGQQEYQQTRQQMQGQTQQHQAAQANAASVSAWAGVTMQQDPDFKPKAAGAVDGKWEFVHKELLAKGGIQAFASPDAALKATQEAYAEANKFFKSFKKSTPVRRPLQSTNNNQNASAVVKTEKDVVAAILAGKKPHQLRYS